MRRLIYVIAAAGILAVAGCRGEAGDRTIVIDRRDSGAYRLGYAHGLRIVRVKDNPDSLHDGLLDIRARETNIRTRLRQSAGEAYIQGFRTSVREADDSLARVLF